LLTTYEVLLADDLSGIQWRYVVVDEAHRLKNRAARVLEALRTVNAERRLLLTGIYQVLFVFMCYPQRFEFGLYTGTPIQNSTGELFTLLHYAEPRVFPSEADFDAKFGHMQTTQQVKELQDLIRPYMIRRLKHNVEKSIPSKEEIIIDIELTVTQKMYYRAIYERNAKFLQQGCSTANTPRYIDLINASICRFTHSEFSNSH
jgi:chromodomain-helicase-DNA-binding protein 7